MSNELNLGQLITTPQQRDATHIAVCPVTAGQRLAPATHVGFLDDGNELVGYSEDTIGIIDPFLGAAVKKGERCWLYLYPNTVTGMRHEWQHPAFPAAVVPVATTMDEKAASVAWLKSAAVALGVSYNEITSEWSPLTRGDYINNGETIRDRWCEMEEEFWRHHKIVTGRDTSEDERGGFTCSC